MATSPGERRFVIGLGVFIALLVLGISTTGIWGLLTRETNPAWESSYVVGSGDPGISTVVGPQAVHGDLADILAAAALIAVIWYSYRVVFRIAWGGLGALALLITAIVSGGAARIYGTIVDSQAVGLVGGYGPVFAGNADKVVASGGEYSVLQARLILVGHLAVLPVLAGLIWASYRRRQRAIASEERQESWLDHLGRSQR